MLKIFIGILIVIATVYFLIKRYETRMVLFIPGLSMALISGTPMTALDAFADRMTTGGLITSICSVMGFTFALKATKCDQHLINSIVGFLSKFKSLLIPLSVLITFSINVAMPSAAGAAAAVGAILIPVLLSAGVSPAMAASTILAGTFGSVLNPGNPNNAFVAEIAGIEVIDVISTHAVASITAVIISAISLTIVAKFLKEDKGYIAAEVPIASSEDNEDLVSDFKPNPIFALVPIIPIVILVLGSTLVPALDMGVPQAMLIGTIVAIVVTRSDVQEVTKSFFNGMGNGYANIIGIIIAAAVFVSGMESIGLIDAFIDTLINNKGIVNIAGGFGPFLLGVVSGSGDAAILAFNEAVTPHAELFGMQIANLGGLATLGGSLGRTMSPIAGAAIVAAEIADVNPMELTKRVAPGIILAAIAGIVILG